MPLLIGSHLSHCNSKDLAFLAQFNYRRDSARRFSTVETSHPEQIVSIESQYQWCHIGRVGWWGETFYFLCFGYLPAKSTERRWGRTLASICACKANENDLHYLMRGERRDNYCRPLCPAIEDEPEPGGRQNTSGYQGAWSGISRGLEKIFFPPPPFPSEWRPRNTYVEQRSNAPSCCFFSKEAIPQPSIPQVCNHPYSDLTSTTRSSVRQRFILIKWRSAFGGTNWEIWPLIMCFFHLQPPLSASLLEFSRFLSHSIALLKDGELISCPLYPGAPQIIYITLFVSIYVQSAAIMSTIPTVGFQTYVFGVCLV